MLERIRNAAAAMTSLARRQEITANNLANVSTAGYRRTRVFESMLESRIAEDGMPYSTRELSERVDATEGTLEFSERQLDVAIIGEGMFVVSDEATGNELYTRSGRFNRDTAGQLVDSAGRPVLGQGGPISIPLDIQEITISPSGEVRSGNQIFDRLRIVSPGDLTAAERLDGSTFAIPQEVQEVEHPQLRQGYLESSNVNAMAELSDMVITSRLFESQQRALRAMDESLERATRDLGHY